jgi:hypothetical protein
VSPAENSFIKSMVKKMEESKGKYSLADSLTDKQLDWLSDIHSKHFG